MLISSKFNTSVIISTLMLIILLPATATASDSLTLTATGKMLEKEPCQLSSAIAPITIPAIEFDKLHNLNDIISGTAGDDMTSYHITATNCAQGDVLVSVIGDAVSGEQNDPRILAIDSGPGAAKNVGIAFLQHGAGTQYEVISPNTGHYSSTINEDGVFTSDLFISFVNYGAPATPGIVTATATLHVEYI